MAPLAVGLVRISELHLQWSTGCLYLCFRLPVITYNSDVGRSCLPLLVHYLRVQNYYKLHQTPPVTLSIELELSCVLLELGDRRLLILGTCLSWRAALRAASCSDLLVTAAAAAAVARLISSSTPHRQIEPRNFSAAGLALAVAVFSTWTCSCTWATSQWRLSTQRHIRLPVGCPQATAGHTYPPGGVGVPDDQRAHCGALAYNTKAAPAVSACRYLDPPYAHSSAWGLGGVLIEEPAPFLGAEIAHAHYPSS